jgi:hypothetical protein
MTTMIPYILMYLLINMGSSPVFAASPLVSPPPHYRASECKKYQLAELKAATSPRITLFSPQGGEVWQEGKHYEIRWESQGVDEVYIGVAVGGKDKGILESEGSNARCGKLVWEIPVGFVTGFGIARSERVRIMIYDVRNSTIRDLSGYFTIEGRTDTAETSPSPATHTELISQDQDEYAKVIVQYYEAIAQGQYREAYEMLGQCKIVLHDADGSAVAFQPRDDYESWLKAQKNIDTLTIVDVKRLHQGGGPYTADHGDAVVTMGIRTYEVTLDIQLREENWTIKSGQNAFLVSVVKGTDDKVRIIGIGTGP